MKISYLQRLYYILKPIIPRWAQIFLRRKVASVKRKFFRDVWPIDESAKDKPEGWSGWPGQKQFAFVLMHDVETELGLRKCHQLIQLDEEMSFRSLFSFVPERYNVPVELRHDLVKRGFEVGVHGLKHDGKLFVSRKKFLQSSIRINHYLREWESVGFVSPSMHRNLEWMHDLNIEYDVSTFDTDPFEPLSDGIGTIFPVAIHASNDHRSYIELPYTLSQDFTLFILMKEKTIDIWKKKLDWIAENGGMALMITHPDYMNHEKGRCKTGEYPMEFYKELLGYVKRKYKGQYWNPLPKEMTSFWKENMVTPQISNLVKNNSCLYVKNSTGPFNVHPKI